MALVVYRHSDWRSPLPPFPPEGYGRYHRPGGRIAHYWCLHPHGPWAEWLRQHGATDPQEIVASRRRTWAARIDVAPVAIGFGDADRWGLTAADLVDDDQQACRDLAERLAADGVDAIRVPSAALPGTDNLVMFGDRAPAPYDSELVDTHLDVPCATTADDGRAQGGLAAHVRHYGQPDAALQAWTAGWEHRYAQPPPDGS